LKQKVSDIQKQYISATQKHEITIFSKLGGKSLSRIVIHNSGSSVTGLVTRETKAVRAVNAKECFMKKVGIIATLFLVLMLAGCQGPVDVEKPYKPGPPSPGMAKALVQLPGASNARAVGLAGAQTYANFFEVALRDSDTGAVTFENADLKKGYIEVEIPPGTYDILLFAGNKTDTPAGTPLLLATSHAQNVEFIAGQIKDVRMTLVTFDVDLTAPSSKVKVNEKFTTGFTVKPRNPLIAPAEDGTLPFHGSTISVDGVISNLVQTGWGYNAGTGIYTYTDKSVSVTSPTGGEKAVIGFTGYIRMFDGTTESTTPVWCYADFKYPEPELGGHFKKEVPVERNAGGNIIIEWEEDETVPGNSLAEQLDWLDANAQDGKQYLLSAYNDESLPPRTLSYGKTLTATLRGVGGTRTVSLSDKGSLFTVGDGVTLILDSGVTLQGLGNNDKAVVLIDGNTAAFTMNGGKIYGNTSTYGGGVDVADGTFIMNGGEISGNRATYILHGRGGGVCVTGSSGTFTMTGGKIYGNTCYNKGGGVNVWGSGTFTMHGGEIYGNDGGGFGGGVYVDGGTFRIVTGTIYGSDEENTSLRNTAGWGAAVRNLGRASYGIFSGSTWNSYGNFGINDDTIRVVNGVLQ
jgi:hypothetical protein